MLFLFKKETNGSASWKFSSNECYNKKHKRDITFEIDKNGSPPYQIKIRWLGAKSTPTSCNIAEC